MWSALELRHVDLGNRRLNRRLVKLADDLLRALEASVPVASGAWAATEVVLPADQTVVTVADREADFYDLFAAPRRAGSHLLIRAKPRRRVRQVEGLLGRAVRATAAAGAMTVELRRGDDRPPRQATL